MANLKILDPVQGLVDYVLDIKPYHTKIVEVLVEYVHTEPIDITIVDGHHLELTLQNPPGSFDVNGDLQPGSLLNPLGLIQFECDSGFDTSGYSTGRVLITSPNPSIPLHAYPAINSGLNNFTINGNFATDIKVGDVVTLNSVIEDYTDTYNVFSINIGTAGFASFVVLGDVTSVFVTGHVFTSTNSGINDGTYIVSAGGSTFDGTYTTVPVDQSIVSSVTGGTIGIVITGGVHSGNFTVAAVEFDAGSIDSQIVPNDALTFMKGNNPHTIVTVVEPLPAIPVLTATQSYVVTVTLDPIEITTALSYSRAEKIYDALGPTFSQIPNEGSNRAAILSVTLSTVISGIPVPDSGNITIGGDYRTSNVFVGDAIKIDTSTGNNGTYTITSITYNVGTNDTTFGVAELIDDATVDGFGTLSIPANAFFVDDDRTSQFVQGRQFEVFGGTLNHTYTILHSDFTQGQTRVRVAESIFDIGAGNTIVGTTGGFVVPGDQTGKYVAGVSFNVTGSPQNDGPYVVDVAGTTFNVGTGLSTIPIADAIDPTPGGELHLVLHGSFKRHVFGFDEHSPICGMVPDTIAHVYIDEKVKFTGLGLELSDDLIAYNLENADQGGFDYPLFTIASSTTPTILFQLSAPLLPTVLDLWFDTTNQIFRQWNGYEWTSIKTANWFDTSANILYYRTIDKFVDTGWVLDSVRFPGFSDFIPAIGETVQIGEEQFPVVEISPGVPQPNFTLATPVPASDDSLLRVTVNNVPAAFVLNTSTNFDITSPLTTDDIVVATVFDRTGTETNAHVTPFDVQPHMVLHTTVTTDATNNAYVVSGGNFIDRFVPFNKFTVFDTTIPNANLGIQNTSGLPIIDVDDVAGTITVSNDYTWLFTVGRVFRVNPSERNYNNFEVQTSSYDGVSDTTTITVTPTPVESSNNDTDTTQQYFYNPPLSVFNIDNVSDVIILPGDVSESFIAGMEILVEGSTANNNAVWTVASTTYDSGNNRTNIFVTGNILDSDATMNASVLTPIFQNYSRDLGIIIGAVYEPLVSGTYNTGQPKTIVLPRDPILSASADAIEYTWVGPVRFDLSMRYADSSGTTMGDNLNLSDELTGGVISTQILDTDATSNTFEVKYVDTVTGLPVNLTDFFLPGVIFSVDGSYSDGISVGNPESNNATYVVLSSVWDEDGTINPGDPGRTIITIETDYDKIPPYNEFTVVSVSNNGTGLSTIELLGDSVNLFERFEEPVFALDVPLVSGTPLLNVMTVTDVQLVASNTVITIAEELIDDLYTGPLGIIDDVYRGNIYFDETNVAPSPPWVHGRAFIRGGAAATLTATTFTDTLTFGWGNILRWNIVDVNQVASTVDLHGDFTAVIFPNDPITITSSQNIDDSYSAVSVSYNGASNISTVEVANPPIGDTPADANINTTILGVNVGTPSFSVDGGNGDHADFIRPGTSIEVVGSLSNNATYTVVSTSYDANNDILTIIVLETPPATDDSGDVQYVKKLGGKLEMDGVDITPWFQYNITELLPVSSEIVLVGDITSDVFDGQQIRILGTKFNNGVVTAASAPTYDNVTKTSTLSILESIVPGVNSIVELPSTDQVKVLGDASMFLQGGDTFTIVGSTGNDATYVVSNVSFDGVYSFLTITTTLPDSTPDGAVEYNERGGWIESLRYQGISLRFNDVLIASVVENADAALLLDAGSLIDAWDYNFFDVGSFDESTGTLIHLYSNTFEN